jgi:hypothetical protein
MTRVGYMNNASSTNHAFSRRVACFARPLLLGTSRDDSEEQWVSGTSDIGIRIRITHIGRDSAWDAEQFS